MSNEVRIYIDDSWMFWPIVKIYTAKILKVPDNTSLGTFKAYSYFNALKSAEKFLEENHPEVSTVRRW